MIWKKSIIIEKKDHGYGLLGSFFKKGREPLLVSKEKVRDGSRGLY